LELGPNMGALTKMREGEGKITLKLSLIKGQNHEKQQIVQISKQWEIIEICRTIRLCFRPNLA